MNIFDTQIGSTMNVSKAIADIDDKVNKIIDINSDVAEEQTKINTRLTEVESGQEELTSDLVDVRGSVTEIANELQTTNQELNNTKEKVSTLESDSTAHNVELVSLDTRVTALEGSGGGGGGISIVKYRGSFINNPALDNKRYKVKLSEIVDWTRDKLVLLSIYTEPNPEGLAKGFVVEILDRSGTMQFQSNCTNTINETLLYTQMFYIQRTFSELNIIVPKTTTQITHIVEITIFSDSTRPKILNVS